MHTYYIYIYIYTLIETAIMDHMRDIIQRFIQKQLFDFKYVHQLIFEYTNEAVLDFLNKSTSTSITASGGSDNVAVDEEGNNNEVPLNAATTSKDPLMKTYLRELITQLIDFFPRLLSTKYGNIHNI